MLNRNRHMLTYVVFSSGRAAIGRDGPPVVGRRGWFAVGIFSAPSGAPSCPIFTAMLRTASHLQKPRPCELG